MEEDLKVPNLSVLIEIARDAEASTCNYSRFHDTFTPEAVHDLLLLFQKYIDVLRTYRSDIPFDEVEVQ